MKSNLNKGKNNMNKKIIRIPEISVGDTCGYSMIEYHMDFTDIINKLLKVNNIDYKLSSMSYGRCETTDDWRVLFELKKGEK
jgi:hypothetical protein|tara:strand:- start:1638 stop:1883 length:246 start_codon:yes stop_codon:yes gene_type:complete